MNLKEKLALFFRNNFLIQLLKRTKFIGLDQISLFDVLRFYVIGISNGNSSNRSSGISYNLFMSVFPLLILIFTLLPYLPHYEVLEGYIFDVSLKAIFPDEKLHKSVTQFIHENMINKSQIEMLSSSMILTLFFSTNGVKSLMAGFKNSYHFNESFSFFKQYFIAFLLTIGFILSLFVCLFLLYYSEFVWGFVYKLSPTKELSGFFISFFTFLFSFFILCLMYTVLYYLGSNFKIPFRWSIPGAFLSCILFFITLFLFGFYIKSFTSNNLFYGSIGTVILVMIWININVMITLIGYEFNLAISVAKNSRGKLE